MCRGLKWFTAVPLRAARTLGEREDKRPEDVTEAAALLEIFRAQPHEQAAENDESE